MAGGDTAAASPPPFILGKPALYGRQPFVIVTHFSDVGLDLETRGFRVLCFIDIVDRVTFCVLGVFSLVC